MIVSVSTELLVALDSELKNLKESNARLEEESKTLVKVINKRNDTINDLNKSISIKDNVITLLVSNKFEKADKIRLFEDWKIIDWIINFKDVDIFHYLALSQEELVNLYIEYMEFTEGL